MAINYPLQQPVNVAPGAVATLTIPAGGALTLTGIMLLLTGTTFTKAHISAIKVKVGPRLIWDLTIAQINAINNYKGNADGPGFLYLDFTERDQALFPQKEIGGIDLYQAMSIGNVIVEVTLLGTAVAPQINAIGFFEPTQGNPVVLKYLNYPASSSVAGKVTLPLNFRGALVKRLWTFYAGTNWTGTANGNVNRMEVKKNGQVIFDQTCLGARFLQVQNKKTPQANLYVTDFIVDNNAQAQITTISQAGGGDAKVYDQFEFNTYLTASDSLNNVVEAIDLITNL
ncbi:major capsid protein P2 [Herbaspirillum aquaticum]|uniref:major capsid protein P2 n=1 Tax=Herbaspirillum aquaticum TaxID=568783 RepID=UPI0024DF0479|nr:major capsid protein P2 [Herbaspirillum aquaticum]